MAKAAKPNPKATPQRAGGKKASQRPGGGPKASQRSGGGPKPPQRKAVPKPAPVVLSSPPHPDMAFRIAWWSLLALVFVVPLAVSNVTWLTGQAGAPLTYDQFDIIKVFFQRFFGLIALCAWSLHMLTKGGKLRRTPVDWLVLGFLGWVLLTSLTSISVPTALFGKYRRFEGFISFVNYAVIYFLVIQLADNMFRLRTLAKTFFWSSTIVCGYGVLQSLGIDPIKWGQLPFEERRAFSTYGNPDLLGGFLVFALAIPLVLALSENRAWLRAIYWAGFFVAVWCWIVAFTRGAWIGGLVALIVLAFAVVRQKVKLHAVDWGGLAITGLAGAVVVGRSLTATNAVMNVRSRLISIIQFNKGSSQTRFQIWQAAINAIKARPIFGFGADTFRLVFPQYKPVEYVAAAGYLSVADNVHNYPLQLATGIGIVGVVLLYVLLGWAAFRSAPVAFAKRSNLQGLVLAGFWAGCAGYVTHLFFGLSVTGSTFLLWLFMGAVLSPTADSRDVKAPFWGVAASGLLVAVVLVALVFNVVYLVADHAYLNARLGQPGSVERVNEALRAVRLNPTNDMYRAEVGLAYQDQFISTLTQALQQQQSGQDSNALLTQARQLFDQAEKEMKATIAFVPAEYDNYVFLSNLYNVAGQYFRDPVYFQNAIKIAQEGIKVERYGPAIRYQYAQALQNIGQDQEAIKQLSYAVEMDPNFNDGSVLLATLYKRNGQPGMARKVLDDSIAAAGGVGSGSVMGAIESLGLSSTLPATTSP